MEVFKEACASDKQSSKVTSKHAILIKDVCNFSYIDYLHAVGDCVGPSNIYSIGMCNGRIKIYLSNLTHVESVVRSGIQINGRRLAVDYNYPDSTKLLLLNVSTEIPNSILEEKLNLIGKVVSSITMITIDIPDPDYAHVLSDRRSVYVKIDAKAVLPQSLKIVYEGKQFEIFIQKDCSTMAETKALDYSKKQSERVFRSQNNKGSSFKASSSSAPAVVLRKRGRPSYKHSKENVIVIDLEQESKMGPKKKHQVKRQIQKRKRCANIKLPAKIKYRRREIDSTPAKLGFDHEQTENAQMDVLNRDSAIFEGTSKESTQAQKVSSTESPSFSNNGNVVPVPDNDSEGLVSNAGDTVPFQILSHHPFNLWLLQKFLKEAKK